MKILKTLIIILLFIPLFLFTNCNNKSNEENTNLDSLDNIDPNSSNIIKFQGKIFSIPSPVQASILFKELNIIYNSEFANPIDNHTKYLTRFKQSLNFGVYGANLTYLQIYEQYQLASSYFGIIKKLGEELGLMNSFNEKIIKRIENNSENNDSLVYIFASIYREIDSYLLNNSRNEIGALIIAGGWLESLYLMTNSIENTQSQEIINRIGEQKNPLENLIELLQPFYNTNSDEFDKLLEMLVELEELFYDIIIEYSYEEPIVIPEEKLTIINSSTKITIPEEKLRKIITKTKEIRNWVIE